MRNTYELMDMTKLPSSGLHPNSASSLEKHRELHMMESRFGAMLTGTLRKGSSAG